MRFSAYLEQFVTTFVQPFRKPNTTACYRRAFGALPPDLAATPLQKLDGMAIQAALNRQAARHPRAAQLTYSCLHVALAKAVQLGYIERNPMQGCLKPVHTPGKASVLSAEQLAAYLATARSEMVYPLLLLMATCGLRRSEALGLQWNCVDLQRGTVVVCKQRLRVHHGYRLQPLKSAASNRTLPLPPQIIADLAAITVRSFSGFVVDTTPEALYKAHRRVLAAAQLQHVTLHGPRHSMATAAAAQGCPMKILQGILGHSKYELTANLYADHLTADAFSPYLSTLAAAVLG